MPGSAGDAKRIGFCFLFVLHCIVYIMLCFFFVFFKKKYISERGGAERRISVPGCDGEGGSAGEPCLSVCVFVCLCLVPGGSLFRVFVFVCLCVCVFVSCSGCVCVFVSLSLTWLLYTSLYPYLYPYLYLYMKGSALPADPYKRVVRACV